jgi:HSP20 family protein
MTLMHRPSPIADLVSMRDAMERLFDDRLFRPFWVEERQRATVPALDLYTTPEAVIAKVALPGVKPEEVDITVTDDLVTVTGSFEEETEKTEAGYVHRELSRGTFRRSFTLPAAIDAEGAKASFQDGLLTLTLPKTEEVKPKHIKVETT